MLIVVFYRFSKLWIINFYITHRNRTKMSWVAYKSTVNSWMWWSRRKNIAARSIWSYLAGILMPIWRQPWKPLSDSLSRLSQEIVTNPEFKLADNWKPLETELRQLAGQIAETLPPASLSTPVWLPKFRISLLYASERSGWIFLTPKLPLISWWMPPSSRFPHG